MGENSKQSAARAMRESQKMGFGSLPAPVEETPAGTTRLMITGKYEKPLSSNERLLIKLIWPNGFTVQESKLVPMATPEPEPAAEAAPEPSEE